MFGLTPWQEYCLIKCYHEGHDEATVGGWHGKTGEAVRKTIRRASDKLVAQGLPRPQPYGRGSREELRACLPEAAGVLTEPPIRMAGEDDGAADAFLRSSDRPSAADLAACN